MSVLGKSLLGSYKSGQEDRDRAVREQRAKDEAAIRAKQAEYGKVVGTLPGAFQKAGQNNEDRVMVCTTRHSQANTLSGAIEKAKKNDVNIIDAIGVPHGFYDAAGCAKVTLSAEGRALWNDMVAAGFQPYIKYEHDGCGMDDWYEMWIKIGE